MYPPSVQDVRDALVRSGLGTRTDAEIERALQWARARCEFHVPQLLDSTADLHLQQYARSLCIDLAVYYLREEVEVDEEGDLPRRLQRVRARLERELAELAARYQAQYRVWVNERVAAPPDPPGLRVGRGGGDGWDAA